MELLRRQLQALIEQLRRDRKQQQHNQHDFARSATSNGGGGDREQFFVHIPKQKQEWHNHNPVMVQPKMPNQN